MLLSLEAFLTRLYTADCTAPSPATATASLALEQRECGEMFVSLQQGRSHLYNSRRKYCNWLHWVSRLTDWACMYLCSGVYCV